ncbi:Xaa-Pro peptidase family protein [Arthrobacter sp. AK01]|uniref:M24 family metallopeptidase n=1 Tax=Arthrobacter sp. AK01 TaxID=2894084 RepID=UPI0022ABC964|nr:Xaa-Pro peptidase family protein [Arthrobacter sp. AK01]
MRHEVEDRLRSMMAERGMDALLCLSPENNAYAAGFVIPSQPLMRWRVAATLLHVDGRNAIVCVDMEETTVRAAEQKAEIRVWREFVDRPMETVATLLKDWGLDSGRVAAELSYLSVAEHAELSQLLPSIQFLPAEELLVRARQIKTPSEMALLERLSRISDEAIRSSLDSVRAGSSEMDLASALTRSVYEQGAQQFKLMIVATGERSQLPNVGPSNRVLKSGDVCRVEIFSVIDGYQAGVCRTAVVGDPPPEAERIYQNLVDCKQLILEEMIPGASSNRVYEKYRAKFDELGLPAISFVAHSIGVNLHEAPYFGPYSNQPIEEGMVLGMEPLVYRSGYGFGMQIKDMVSIGATGPRVLSDVIDTEKLFRIEA